MIEVQAIAEMAWDIGAAAEERDYWLTEVEPLAGIVTEDYVLPRDFCCSWVETRLPELRLLEPQEVRRRISNAMYKWMGKTVEKGRREHVAAPLPPVRDIPADLLMDLLQRSARRAEGIVRRRKNIKLWGTVATVRSQSGENIPASEFWSDGWIYIATHTADGDSPADVIRRCADYMADAKERDETDPQPPRKNGSRERIVREPIDIELLPAVPLSK
ncbi:hypothetical protein [Promicromonospora sp. NFX87]|uniref:hypothetical protein n=1 Tax=Promicromonospora sp. NFX87 TaxID=3402691 RepID=UPI003AFB5DCE